MERPIPISGGNWLGLEGTSSRFYKGYGNNLTDKKGGEDDLEVIGRLLASGKDDFWDEEDEDKSETPPQSPNKALEKLRTRIASPKIIAALRASKPPKFVHSPSKPATPHQSRRRGGR